MLFRVVEELKVQLVQLVTSARYTWSWLNGGNGTLGADSSGCSTIVDPSAAPDGGELDGGRAADGTSSSENKQSSGWPKSLRYSSSNPTP